MTLGGGLVAYLAGVAPITALVADRIIPETVLLVEKVYPLIVYKISNLSSLQTYSGANGLTSAILELVCIGQTYASADDLADAVIVALDGLTALWGTINVQGCFLADDGVVDDVVTEADTPDVTAYLKTVSFDVKFNR